MQTNMTVELGRTAVLEIEGDRKSTRLNSSHDQISYAVFCLKKKSKQCKSYTNYNSKFLVT